jgi:predicted GNAT family acetyltransferase
MQVEEISNKREIEIFLRKDPYLNIYGIGDLDNFFWKNTKWFAFTSKNIIKGIILLYHDSQSSVMIALNRTPLKFPSIILKELISEIPIKFYAHITDDYKNILSKYYNMEFRGAYYKMGLRDSSILTNIDSSEVVVLTAKDIIEIQNLYDISYPGNWFNCKMVETGQYYGIRKKGSLISIAGVHVYSEAYRVAAIGNIATHPDYRNMGLASKVTAHLCKSILNKIDHIGLNVQANNHSAIKCYNRLGFETISMYEEYFCN